MPLDISTNAVLEKNKITSDGVWLTLLKLEYEGETPGYSCLNNTEVTWNGNTYSPAIFNLSGISENKDGEIPSISLSIYDFQGTLLPLIEAYNGALGATVTIYLVHSKYLDNIVPELEIETEIIDVTISNNRQINFKLGSENLIDLRLPPHRYLKNVCRFAFKSSQCGYTGTETQCNRTFTRCKELGNQTRYGGFPGVGSLGLKV